MIYVQTGVLLDVFEDDRLTEINEDCILLHLKSID